MNPHSTGPIKQPAESNPVISDEMAELMGSKVRKGDILIFVDAPGEEWPAIVTQVKANQVLDLAAFTTDGNTLRLWNVPAANAVLEGKFWKNRG